MSGLSMTSRTSAGFTLIEVMITVGIVAILAAIAIPAYSTYATRGRIPEATVGLGARQVDMEQYFQDNRKYASAAPACTDDGESKFFTFSCTGITDTTFTLVATGKGAMSGFTFNVNQANLKTTAAVPSGWSQPSPNNCWVRNKGGVC